MGRFWGGIAALLVGCAVIAGIVTQAGGRSCSDTLSSGANLRAALASASSGDTICLNAGSYTWSGRSVTKTSMTTVQRAAGVARSATTIGDIPMGESHYITLDGLTITGQVGIGTWTSGTTVARDATNVVVKNSDISHPGYVCIANADSTVVLGPGNLFADNANGCAEGRVSILGNCRGPTGTSNCPGNGTDHASFGGGPVIIGNTFTGSGARNGVCTDMVQSTYSANGWTAEGNTFTNLLQSGCGATHTDVIQPYTAGYYTISRNWLDNFSSGIMNGDCDGPAIYSQNVFTHALDNGNAFRVTGDRRAYTIDHNTLQSGQLTFGTRNCESSAMTNVTITNNVFGGETLWIDGRGVPQSGASLSSHVSGRWNWNMTPDDTSGVRGDNGIDTETWSYAGGVSPRSWGGFQLASDSNGYHAAEGGSSIGINP
jgi:hypothetical protein